MIQIQEKSSVNKGKLTPLEIQILCNSKQFKEECEKFAKIAEHLVKIVYGEDSQHYNAWKERKQYFNGPKLEMEEFCQRLKKL